MTTQEFSDQFDVLYNNISSNKAPGLNEYEKSVFLTKGQTELLLNHFTPESQGNTVKKGFDESIIRQADFSSLVKVANCNSYDDTTLAKIDRRSILFYYLSSTTGTNNIVTYNNDVLLPINEVVQIFDSTTETTEDNTVSTKQLIGTYQVTPISYDEYNRMMLKPFKRPNKGQAWRLLSNSDTKGGTAKIIEVILPKEHDAKNVEYVIRYIKKPNPIILTNLTYDGVSINGFTIVHGCDLDEIVHEQVLQRAVELAKAAYIGDINASIETGKRSE